MAMATTDKDPIVVHKTPNQKAISQEYAAVAGVFPTSEFNDCLGRVLGAMDIKHATQRRRRLARFGLVLRD